MKRVLAVSDEELRGAIAAGRYRPAAAQRLFDVLVKRRAKMARAFLADVAPLDFFRFDERRICFDDLWLVAGLGGESFTEYQARSDDATLPVLDRCVELAPRAGYRVLALRVKRPGDRHLSPPVRAHFIERSDGARYFVGIER
jgi:hypothetical protein